MEFNPQILTPFKRAVIQQFPFIEEDFDALTNYGLLSKIVEYLNTLLNSQNAVNEQTVALTNAFNALYDYVNNYFENLDVQEEINIKLDELAESGELGNLMAKYIEPQFNELKADVNADIDEIRSIVNAVSSGNPIPVSSTSDMTDTTKTYLLTTDGYWYYYDGDSWERGGVYQSTEIADFSVTPVKTDFSKRSNNLIDIANANTLTCIIDNTGLPNWQLVQPGSNNGSIVYVPVEAGKTYTFARKNTSSPRFVVGFTKTTPAAGVQVYDRHENNASSVLYDTRTAPSGATHAVFYYARASQIPAGLTSNDLLATLSIKEGTNTSYTPSYIISVGTDNITDESVTPDKVSFNKDSRNLFDKNNANIGNIHSVSGVLTAQSGLGSISIPCDGNKVYTILKTQSSRFEVSTTATQPANGVSAITTKFANTATKITISTPPNANYISVYLYNSSYDTLTLQQILATLCITEGDNDTYIPYGKIISVTTDNYADNSVTMEKLNANVKNSILGINPIQSRSGIYGVTFDLTSNSTKGTRIGNAAGLQNDYIIGDNFQLNAGVNDFDNIYPWSDIRRCNLKFVNGVKTVTYDDDDDFALDGSNGEVMVEIPKFYSYRKIVDGKETWAISGEPKAEFSVEPAFIVDGKELDYIYVACYNGSKTAVNGCFSTSGTEPESQKQMQQTIEAYNTVGLNGYDITTFFALQKLMMIEFGDRDVQSYLGGITYLPYFYTGDTVNVITAVGENTVSVINNNGGGRKGALWVGERIKFIPSGTPEASEDYARYITDITTSDTTSVITYSGTDLSGTLNVGDGIGGCPQKSGLTDSLDYHTGRTTYASGNAYESFVNPMRYRYIENLYGNVWEQIAGLKLMDLNYYLSYEPDTISSITDSPTDYFVAGYKAPLQPQLGEGGAGYIVKEGYDNNDHNLALPVLCGISNGGGDDKYWSDAFYSKNESSTKQYECVVGGGFDHYKMAGIFCLRGWNNTNNNGGGLYGNRPIYRG